MTEYSLNQYLLSEIDFKSAYWWDQLNKKLTANNHILNIKYEKKRVLVEVTI